MSLETLLNETLAVEPWASTDRYQKPTYGASVDFAARIQQQQVAVRDEDGNEVIADSKIWLLPAAWGVVTTKSRVTMPDGETPLVLAVERMPDGAGETYYVRVFTGKARR